MPANRIRQPNRPDLKPAPPYEPTAFWSTPPPGVLGPWDPANPDTSSPVHKDQEAALATVLASLTERRGVRWPRSIFEAGCGMGRIARFFNTHYPTTPYHAIDLNVNHLESAQTFHPSGRFEQADLLNYDIFTPWEDPSWHGYDLVIASEVLMHVRPADLEEAIEHLLGLANPYHGYVITIDWVPQSGELKALARGNGIAPWNFPHQYQKAFAASGACELVDAVRTHKQVIHVVKP